MFYTERSFLWIPVCLEVLSMIADTFLCMRRSDGFSFDHFNHHSQVIEVMLIYHADEINDGSDWSRRGSGWMSFHSSLCGIWYRRHSSCYFLLSFHSSLCEKWYRRHLRKNGIVNLFLLVSFKKQFYSSSVLCHVLGCGIASVKKICFMQKLASCEAMDVERLFLLFFLKGYFYCCLYLCLLGFGGFSFFNHFNHLSHVNQELMIDHVAERNGGNDRSKRGSGWMSFHSWGATVVMFDLWWWNFYYLQIYKCM